MPRPRDRASAAGLLPRMEARPRKDGLTTYRYHPVNGRPINLGTDKLEACRRVLYQRIKSPSLASSIGAGLRPCRGNSCTVFQRGSARFGKVVFPWLFPYNNCMRNGKLNGTQRP